MRRIMLASIIAALTSAFVTYGLNNETRLRRDWVHARERDAGDARLDIAVLRAERAHLARPQRIEPLARALGLRPAEARNFVGTPPELAGSPPPVPYAP